MVILRMGVLHGLFDSESLWALLLMALLAVSLIAVLAYGLLKAYGKPSNPTSEGLQNDGEQPGHDSKVE